ncbi:hypothetical protein BgAZ_302540 [Babesia gibsoni]|uniref:Uncharacterized protein n=1 Tax=Babesia gibsoni TaxID=33632 RepID=A0AAD8LPX7_BABGI|nr:hypothetical protein BgAZ_302540 [Babesia gibsoni]
MHSVNRFAAYREPAFQQSSVRRYNVDYRQLYRAPEALIQDGATSLRLYVVARRSSVANFQSYMPFDLYTQTSDWEHLQDACEVPEEDIFDRSISSSEDGRTPYSIPRSSPYIASASSRSSHRRGASLHGESPQYLVAPPSAKRSVGSSVRGSSPVPASIHREAGFDPQDEGPAYQYPEEPYAMPTTDPSVSKSAASHSVSFAKSVLTASPKQKGKRTLSGSRNVETLSPTGYSPFASFGAIYSSGLDSDTTHGLSAVTANALATIERLKKKGADKKGDRAQAGGNEIATGRGRKRKGGSAPSSTEYPGSIVGARQSPGKGAGLHLDNVNGFSSDEITFYDVPPYDGAQDFTGDQATDGPMSIADFGTVGSSKRPKTRGKRGKAGYKGAGGLNGDLGALPSKSHKSLLSSDVRGELSTSHRSDQGVQTTIGGYTGYSVGVGDDDFNMDEYGSFADKLHAGKLGMNGSKESSRYTRRQRKAVNSAMLLNSWYISYGDESKKPRKKYQHVPPYENHNRRYPTRSRLPPVQHWNSNLTADGSSVLFLIGVTSDDENLVQQAQHASGDVLIMNDDTNNIDNTTSVVKIPVEEMPEASLVLTDSQGYMEMQVIETSAEQPLAIENAPLESARKRSVPFTVITRSISISDRPDGALSRSMSLLDKPDGALSRSMSLLDKPDGALSRSQSIGDWYGKPAKAPLPIANKKQGKRATTTKLKKGATKKKGSTSKKKKEMTVREALEILKVDSLDSLALNESVVERVSEESAKSKSPKPRRQASFYQEMALDVARSSGIDKLPSDSVTMQNGKQISYRSFFRVNEVESQLYKGSIFQPMIMNSRCRSSNVIIPVGRMVDMGNVKANFICGYLFGGENVFIRGHGMSWELKPKHTFFLPMFEEWAIHNDSPSMDANITLTFVSI